MVGVCHAAEHLRQLDELPNATAEYLVDRVVLVEGEFFEKRPGYRAAHGTRGAGSGQAHVPEVALRVGHL
eukprot:11067870-Heterocapsa_arctica.AAC.1